MVNAKGLLRKLQNFITRTEALNILADTVQFITVHESKIKDHFNVVREFIIETIAETELLISVGF